MASVTTGCAARNKITITLPSALITPETRRAAAGGRPASRPQEIS
jgi:hypothetical protein